VFLARYPGLKVELVLHDQFHDMVEDRLDLAWRTRVVMDFLVEQAREMRTLLAAGAKSSPEVSDIAPAQPRRLGSSGAIRPGDAVLSDRRRRLPYDGGGRLRPSHQFKQTRSSRNRRVHEAAWPVVIYGSVVGRGRRLCCVLRHCRLLQRRDTRNDP
jgi:DNA-binding transcriptional LysR family regulator